MVSATPWSLCTPVKDPVLLVQEAGWAPGPVWTGAENLASHRDSTRGPSSPQPVAILTELSGPHTYRTFDYMPTELRHTSGLTESNYR